MGELTDKGIQWVESNLRLINDVIDTCFGERADKEDMFQEGYIGMHKALIAYDETRGMKLSTLVWSYVKWELVKYILNQNPTGIKIPRHVREQHHALQKSLERGEDLEELLIKAKWTLMEVNEIECALGKGEVRIDQPLLERRHENSNNKDISRDLPVPSFEEDFINKDYRDFMYKSTLEGIKNERHKVIIESWIKGDPVRVIAYNEEYCTQLVYRVTKDFLTDVRCRVENQSLGIN